MSKVKNLIYLLIFSGILLALKLFVVDRIFTSRTHDADIWFTSGLLLIVLGLFVTEKYFTKSLDVIVNVIMVTVVLLTLNKPEDFRLWGALLTYSTIIGIIALVSFVLFDDEKDQNHITQKIANSGSTIARFLGSSRFLFSVVFVLSIFNYFVFSIANNIAITDGQLAVLSLIVFWGIVLLIEPIDRKLIQPVIEKIKNKQQPSIIGKLVKRVSPSIIVAEEMPKTPSLKPGTLAVLDTAKRTLQGKNCNILMYLYSQDAESKRFSFFYALNSKPVEVSEQIFVHSISADEQPAISAGLAANDLVRNRENLIGFVHTGSNIDIIKIKMVDGIDEAKQLKEGDLVSVNFYKNPTKYQIINVETTSENVEGANKQGGKIISAQQIGMWREERQKFEDIGWVPEINAPAFIESAEGEVAPLPGDNYRVGVVPKSKYPVYINFEETISHHLAIIGKTGTGKSQMAAKMITKLVGAGYKIVILEVDRTNPQSLSRRISAGLISSENTTWTSRQIQRRRGGRAQQETAWDCEINFDAADGRNIFVINLDIQAADMEGGPLSHSESANAVLKKILQYKNRPGNADKKVCVVMEEAYDFIPESTFGQQDFGQPNVSRIAQLLLKCRKHNIGFVVITQRTALVSKTILYQCNTIIALQTFDETSKNFMGAYISQKYLDSMSILPRFRAIVVGKGSSCDKPVIVNFEEPNA